MSDLRAQMKSAFAGHPQQTLYIKADGRKLLRGPDRGGGCGAHCRRREDYAADGAKK
jgi:hypothetical protein